MTSISVITPTLARPGNPIRFRCIPSVRGQTGLCNPAQHIVVPGVTPAGLARRDGCDMADGDLIAYCDDDDMLLPGHLASLAAALAGHPDAGYAWSQMLVHLGDWHTALWPGPPDHSIATPMLMHRRELLNIAAWGDDPEREEEELIAQWAAAGITGVPTGQVTCEAWASPERVKVLFLYARRDLIRIECVPGCGCSGQYAADGIARAGRDLDDYLGKVRQA